MGGGGGAGSGGGSWEAVGCESPVGLLSFLQFLFSMLLEDIQGIVSCQAG